MTLITKITCDQCQKDLTFSDGAIDNCLILKERCYGPDSNVVRGTTLHPILVSDLHFCNFDCLRKFLDVE
jgi:hypothetical protein